MGQLRTKALLALLCAGVIAASGCENEAGVAEGATATGTFGQGGPPDDRGGGGGHTETAGNNLSFPVIWSEGVTKALRGTAGTPPVLGEAWWYWWGTTLAGDPLSCAPDPQDQTLCDNGLPPGAGAVKAYLQQDAINTWQAGTADWSAALVVIDWIDWGDNLESADWYITSKVRVETVLYQDLATPMLEYQMRHLYGWGQSEMWGVSVAQGTVEPGPGTQATVYSPCARLTIQKLLVDRDDAELANLEWDETVGQWTEPLGYGTELIDDAIFNEATWLAGDGPGYYSAEINVKGRIIYGYTWNVRQLNDGAGDYRITYSLDGTNCTSTLNTFFQEPTTNILEREPEEPVVEVASDDGGEAPVGGATPQIIYSENLTYVDVRIKERLKGGDKGKSK